MARQFKTKINLRSVEKYWEIAHFKKWIIERSGIGTWGRYDNTSITEVKNEDEIKIEIDKKVQEKLIEGFEEDTTKEQDAEIKPLYKKTYQKDSKLMNFLVDDQSFFIVESIDIDRSFLRVYQGDISASKRMEKVFLKRGFQEVKKQHKVKLEDQILNKWDELYFSDFFPYYYEDRFILWNIRLHVFLYKNKWFLVFENLGFSYSGNESENLVLIIDDNTRVMGSDYHFNTVHRQDRFSGPELFPTNNIPLVFKGKDIQFSLDLTDCRDVKNLKNNEIEYIDALKLFTQKFQNNMWLKSVNMHDIIPKNSSEIFTDTGLHVVEHLSKKIQPSKSRYWIKIANLITSRINDTTSMN